MNTNKFGKAQTGITSWAIKYKGKRIGAFRFHGNLWLVSYFKSFPSEKWFDKSEKYLSDELKDFIVSNINITPQCGNGGCKGVENQIILGKEYPKVCGCEPIKLINPDGKILEYAKKIALIGKTIISDMLANSTK